MIAWFHALYLQGEKCHMKKKELSGDLQKNSMIKTASKLAGGSFTDIASYIRAVAVTS
jgi:hypothetical protein